MTEKQLWEAIEFLHGIGEEEIGEFLEWKMSRRKENETTKTSNIDNIIYDIMKDLGVPAHLKGYSYIVESIKLSLEDKTYIEGGITKNLYPAIAKKFQTTSTRVERGIRHAIETMMERTNIETISKIFGYSYSSMKGKPTNSEFIAGICQYLKINNQ